MQLSNRKLITAQSQPVAVTRVLRKASKVSRGQQDAAKRQQKAAASQPLRSTQFGSRKAKVPTADAPTHRSKDCQLDGTNMALKRLKSMMFASDASKAGYAVYSFDLPKSPEVFLQPMSAADWQELQREPPHLEARAIRLGLASFASSRQAQRALNGAEVVWLTDNSSVACSLAQGPRPNARDSCLRQEYRMIHALLLQLGVSVHWRWRSRKRASMILAHQLSAVSGTHEADSKAVQQLVAELGAAAQADLLLAQRA